MERPDGAGRQIDGHNSDATTEFDKGLKTRNMCFVGLAFTFCLASAAIAISAMCINRKVRIPNVTAEDEYWQDNTSDGMLSFTPPIDPQALPYLLIAVVTVCTETLDCIHSVTLRWALIHEGRAKFNSNLRLLTAARSSRANTWQFNLLYAILLVTTYTAAGQVLDAWGFDVYVSSLALLILGGSLLGLCLIAAYTIYGGRTAILTWSANPLNTTLACLHTGII